MVKDSTQEIVQNKQVNDKNPKKKGKLDKTSNQIMRKKSLDYVLILPYQPKEKDIYYIVGDISIDFDLIRNKKDPVIISSLSAWRKVLQIEKSSQRIHLTLEKPKQLAITNFDFITKKLLSLGDQRYQQFAVAMDNYKEKQQEFENIKKRLMISKSIDFSVQYWLSKLRAFNILYNLQKSSIKYYAYHICAGSYEGQILMEKGYSEDLIKVLGMDFETFKSITLRRGMIDFLNPESQLNIVLRRMLSYEDIRVTYSPERQYKTTIITADSFTIDVITKPQLLILNEGNIHEQSHLNDTIGFIEIEIEEKVIRELEQKRKVSRQLMLDSDYDLEYDMQVEVFIKDTIAQTKSIKDDQPKIVNQTKSPLVAKYRHITKPSNLSNSQNYGNSNTLNELQNSFTEIKNQKIQVIQECEMVLPLIQTQV